MAQKLALQGKWHSRARGTECGPELKKSGTELEQRSWRIWCCLPPPRFWLRTSILEGGSALTKAEQLGREQPSPKAWGSRNQWRAKWYNAHPLDSQSGAARCWVPRTTGEKGEQAKCVFLMLIPYNFFSCSSFLLFTRYVRDNVHADPPAAELWGPPGYTKENLIGEQWKCAIRQCQRRWSRTILQSFMEEKVLEGLTEERSSPYGPLRREWMAWVKVEGGTQGPRGQAFW